MTNDILFIGLDGRRKHGWLALPPNHNNKQSRNWSLSLAQLNYFSSNKCFSFIESALPFFIHQAWLALPFKCHFHKNTTSDKFSPLGNDNGLSGGSEVENSASDEDMEDMKQ